VELDDSVFSYKVHGFYTVITVARPKSRCFRCMNEMNESAVI